MPELELHDLTNDQTFAVPAEGLVFGREGGDADVQLADSSISRRQARISYKGGNWLYETMSAPQGKPMPRPRALAQGETFRIGRTEFEVLNVGEEEEPEPEPTPALPRGPVKKAQKPPPAQAKTMAGQPAEAGEEEAAPKSFGAMFVAVPRGIAYYLVNVPKMLFNPVGTVNTGIEELPAEPMGRIELIGYALPALLGTMLLGSWAGGLASLIRPGHVFDLWAFLAWKPALMALVGAIVTGFAFHPVLEWVMRKVFKGTTDARSRTNYFLQNMTLSVLLAVPNALGVILGALPIPFIKLLGPLLTTLASLVALYVVFQWWTRVFEVVKWARTLLLVLGALAVAFAAFTFVSDLISTIRGLGSSAVSATGNADADAALAEAEKATKEAQEQAEAASEKGGEAAAKARKLSDELKKKAEAEAAAAEAGARELKPIDDKKPEVKVAEARPAEKPQDKKAPEPEPKAEAVPAAVPAAGEASGAYGAWAKKRERLEKLLEADPTRLEGNKELQDLYGTYLERCADVEKKYKKDIAKHADKARLYEHLRDAELFHSTNAVVDDLARRLGVR